MTQQENREKNIHDIAVYKFFSFLWRKIILYPMRRINSIIVRKKASLYWREKVKKYGIENRDKTFYVIRRQDMYCGIFSLFLTNLVRIDEAIEKGFIPIIDMQSNFNIYLDKSEIGRKNAWEYYFEQPMGIGLEAIKKSKNVILSSGCVPAMFPYLDVDFLYGKTGELDYWRQIAHKYIRVSENVKDIVEKAYNELFDETDKVLGVKCRGTDYTKTKPKNHPIQPTPKQALEQVEKIFSEKQCTKIFLATEDVEFYNLFYEKFGDKLVTNKTDYLEYQGGSIGKEEYGNASSGYELGLEYVVTTMLLSKCDCLCAGCASATVAALLLTEGYEYTYLFDLGVY